jgi:arylsulfatase A-like enzyme
MGFLQRRGETVFVTADGGQCRFLEHVDYHVGRVIDHLEEMGELDNTLVIYLSADNGATAEGTPTGTFSELLMQNGFPPLTMEQQLEKLEEFGGLDAWGGPHMANHFSVAWAYASSTPFQWTKQMASHFGGTMSATAIRYPKAIEARGEWRRQFQNVTDLVPTILEVTGVPAPDYVNGQKRKPYPGKSLTYAWNNADAKQTIPPSILKCWVSWACIMMAGPLPGNRIGFPGR